MSEENKVDGGGLRFNSGKIPLELVPPSAVYGIAEVLQYGMTRSVNPYPARNWERGMNWMVCVACILRHLFAWVSGEDKDKDSGLSHMKHVLCNVAFLVEYENSCPNLDDRPNKKE